MVGTQRTIMRACDSLNRLIELNLYLNISDNQAPEFKKDLQTEWSIWINETVDYTLPAITTDSIDTSTVYINAMENQPFPGFLAYNNATKTIAMRPKNDTQYQGQTYYFSVVLKRTHSDYIMNTYYITVKFKGDIYVAPVAADNTTSNDSTVANDTFEPEKITYNISEITWKSKGQIQFSQPVNMTNIAENFLSLFDVYVDCKTRNKTEEVKGFVVTSYDNDMTLNFTAEFMWPYLYGLLNKKKDYLVIAVKNGTNESEFIYNTTGYTLGNNNTKFSIPMQFDYRSTNFFS